MLSILITTIIIYKKKDFFCGFDMFGHADYSTENDILCSALSFLSTNTCNSMEKICGISTDKDMNLSVGDGSLKMFIDVEKLNSEVNRDVQTIFKSFEVGIIALKEEYSKYIEIYYKEV